MKVFPEFRYMPPKFWALVRFVSQELKYTDSDSGLVRAYSEDEIIAALDEKGYNVEYELVRSVSRYSQARAELHNNLMMPNDVVWNTNRFAEYMMRRDISAKYL